MYPSVYFELCANGNFHIFPFYKINEENEQLWQAKEEYFIRLFQPKLIVN